LRRFMPACTYRMSLTRLPPLTCLQAFEASSRYLSFTLAGRELHASPSAISRQIAQLEAFLGRSLFVRKHNSLRLTPAGEAYAVDVRQMLDFCVRVTSNVMARAGKSRLTVACTAGLSAFWLAPRIGTFLDDNPDIDLRIIVRDHFGAVKPAEYDVGIFYLRTSNVVGTHTQRLFDETVYAVCAPGYLKGARLPPSELTSHTLLILEDAERSWMSWQSWFERNGIERPSIASTLVLNSYPLLIELAVKGKGIALAWEGVIDPLLAHGTLVKASDAQATMGGAYHLTWPADRAQSDVSCRFRSWVIKQIKKTA